MAKGNIAKDKVIEKIAQAFGQNYIGIYDKKVYVWSEENGEKVQKLQLQTNRDLLQEATNIGDLKKYNMMLQNISISPNVNNYIKNSFVCQ